MAENKTTDKKAASSGQRLSTPQIAIIGGFAVVIVALVVVMVYLLVGNGNSDGNTVDGGGQPGNVVPMQNAGNVVMTEDNYDEIQKQMNENNLFYVSMNTTWTFANGTAISEDAVMNNSDLNPTDMFITITVPGENQILYTSPIVPPGAALKDIQLGVDLDPGVYDTVCVHHVLDANGEEEAQVSMQLTILVVA